MYLGGPHRVLLGFNSPLSLILLHPVDDRDRTRKGIKFWMESLIINSTGELDFWGRLGFNLSKGPSPTTVA